MTLASIRIGTRGSKLALWQAEWVTGQLKQRGYTVELCVVQTQGDVSTASLSQVGGQGLFTKEIQRELLDERVDVAVHSLKDLPTIPIEGLHLAAVPPRESTDDCLISSSGLGVEGLPSGAAIGTGSSRRASQLRSWRPDLEIRDIRGNVDSRLSKLDRGEYDAIVLAAAGLNRLGLEERITQRIPVERMLPAVGQGALGLECRSMDETTRTALEELDDPLTHAAVSAERSLLQTLLAGCLAPVAALGTVTDNGLHLRARVSSLDGTQVLEASMTGTIEQATSLGEQLAEHLRSQGAADIIERARLQIK